MNKLLLIIVFLFSFSTTYCQENILIGDSQTLVLPIIYLIGILSLFVFGTVLVISDNTKWIWPGKALISLSSLFLITIKCF